MPTWKNQLETKDVQNSFLTIAYGLHIVEGHLCKSIKGDGSPFDIWVQHKLGKGEWNGCKSLYWRGFNIPSADFVLHPGTASTGNADTVQGVDTIFDKDIPHNMTAWIRAKLPQSEIQDINPATDSVEGLWGIYETRKISDYSNTGTETDFGYSANAAREVADLILKEAKLPGSIIDWGAWKDWRDFLATNTTQDYLDIPNFSGIGLTAKFYNGSNFDTFISERVDAVINFTTASGRPASGLNEIFSVRFEGKIKPRFSETYTFYLYHDDGGKLWVNGSLIIDQFGTNNAGNHSATIALTANTIYDIKVEWRNDAGANGVILEWESTTQPREVVPSECLYPLPISRPLYETHVEFTSPTRLDDAIRKILYLSNSFMQRVNGKYRFLNYEQLGSAAMSLTENTNYYPNTLEKIPRDLRRRNIYKATARDIDSQYLQPFSKPISIERANLIAQSGRVDGSVLDFETMSRYQVWHLLEQIMKRECDPDFEYSLTGNCETYKLQKDDLVELDSEFLNETAKEFLIWKSRDKSSEKTADDREFILREWIS